MHQANSIVDLKPFVKWVGAKNSSISALHALMPEKINTYVELFVGSGALFFASNFDRAIINDNNQELVNAYQVIRDHVGELEFFLSTLVYDKDLYLKIRAWDREPNFLKRDPIERAGRFIYLMKTCYNGLYRVSKKDHFNTPFGQYKAPNICDVKTLNACSKFLQDREVVILNQDYGSLLDSLTQDCFVYLDPPYFPLSKTANFTSYQKEGFSEGEQLRLFEFCNKLHERGIKFLLSNSDVEEIRTLYAKYRLHVIKVPRRINSNINKRAAVNELAICNYDVNTGMII